MNDVNELKALVVELDRIAVDAGIYGMTVAKSLEERDRMNRERGSKLLTFRSLLKRAAEVAENL